MLNAADVRTETDAGQARKQMAGGRMVHRHRARMLIVAKVRKVVDQTAHHRVAPHTHGTAAVNADQADLRRWIMDADLPEAVMLIADQVVATQTGVRQKAATGRAMTEDVLHATTKAAGTLGLQCEAVDRHSLVVAPVLADHRGCSTASHSATDLRSDMVDPVVRQWAPLGCKAEIRQVVDHRFVTANRDAHQWDHPG